MRLAPRSWKTTRHGGSSWALARSGAACGLVCGPLRPRLSLRSRSSQRPWQAGQSNNQTISQAGALLRQSSSHKRSVQLFISIVFSTWPTVTSSAGESTTTPGGVVPQRRRNPLPKTWLRLTKVVVAIVVVIGVIGWGHRGHQAEVFVALVPALALAPQQ